MGSGDFELTVVVPKGSVPPIAVSAQEANEFGCPHCGFRSSYTFIIGQGTGVLECGECNSQYIVLAEGLTKSTFGIGEDYPELVDHPRRGIPSRGREDLQPKEGGEYFRPRGIGLDTTPGCFVCGGPKRDYHNLSGYVRTKEAGERIVAMFSHGAWLDFREWEPDYLQVKVGACANHLPNLNSLDRLTRPKGVITRRMIAQATSVKV